MNKYIRIKRARAGGKKRGFQERKEALLRYNKNPHFCMFCGNIIEVGKKRVADVIKKKFCNNSCAASFNNKAHPQRYKKPIDASDSVAAS